MQRFKLIRRTSKRHLERGTSRDAPSVQITLSGSTAERFLKSLIAQPSEMSRSAMPVLETRVRPTLRPWVGVIDQIIKEDAGLPKRVRTSAMQILKTLREDHGYTGCYNVIQEYIRQARNPGLDFKRKHKPRTEPPVTECITEQTLSPVGPISPEVPISSQTAFTPLTLYRQSRRVQRLLEPEEQATGWMSCVQQGAIPFEVLVTELPDLPLPELEILLKAARTGKLSIRNRSMAVMSYMRGIASAQICSFLQISTGSLFRYVRAYRKGGSTELLTRKERSDKQSNNEEIKAAVFALLHSPPSAHGVNRTTWTIAELQKILSTGPHPAGAEAIRTIIRESGFKWRHARIVLTSHDPDYRTKVEAITKILSELQDDEAFCSVDEYGPFAVKIKGGRKRVAPGEQYVVPQRQKSKGWMILTAALELKRNQVTHFYSRKKDTNEMIRMADTLRSKYRSYRTVYVSWDAASWHVSKRLLEHLEALNLEAPVLGFPVVKIAPLPAGAQFLNVIESVFSGMARAIIHNSNYDSPETAKSAIDRYFADRNAHFAEHPKRAGQKIWGKERVPSIFAESNNCKDPNYQNLY